MNRKSIIVLLLAMLLTVTVVLLPLQAGLGFGDFDSGSDYGGSDYGGSDSWGSSYDSDSGSYRDSSGSSSGDGKGLVFVLLFFGVIFGFRFLFVKLLERISAKKRERAWAMKQARMSDFRRQDPAYNEQELTDWCKRLFVRMQEAWEKGDITPVQYGFLPDTWNRFNTQLQMKNQRGETTHVRDIHFSRVAVQDYERTKAVEKLSVEILVEYNVWVTNRLGENIQGTPNTRHRMNYVWTLQRPYGSVSGKKAMDETHCPNCGAELDIAAFAECPFCKAQIGRKSEDWLLADITAISQKTIH